MALAGIIRHSGRTELQCVGAGGVNQATNLIAIARHYLAPGGIDIVCIPDLAAVCVADQYRMAVRLIVEARSRARRGALPRHGEPPARGAVASPLSLCPPLCACS